MTWFKVDDQLAFHPKVIQAGNSAMGLWVRAGAHCASHKTNGRISHQAAQIMRATQSQITALVEANLWEVTGDGWKFVHWRKHQDGDYRPNIPPKIRKVVFTRDGHACVLCGSIDNLSLDHIIRYRDDGPDTVENLRVLCMPCNLERG